MASGGVRDHQVHDLTHVFKPLLVEFLQCKVGFLTGLNAFLKPDDADEIQAVEVRSRTQAVVKLLEILSKCTEPGLYAAFIASLKSNKMEHIAEMIEEGNVESGLTQRLKYHRELVTIFLPELIDIDPIDIIPYLPCLTDDDKEEIINIQTQQNGRTAALKLLIYLGRKGEEWLDQLVGALEKTRHRRLAAAIAETAEIASDDVDPKTFVSRKQAAQDYWRSKEVKTASNLNGFDTSDLYLDEGIDGEKHQEDKHKLDTVGQCLDQRCRSPTEPFRDSVEDYDGNDTEDPEEETDRKENLDEVQWTPTYPSLEPDEEGSITFAHSSLSSVDNLEYFDAEEDGEYEEDDGQNEKEMISEEYKDEDDQNVYDIENRVNHDRQCRVATCIYDQYGRARPHSGFKMGNASSYTYEERNSGVKSRTGSNNSCMIPCMMQRRPLSPQSDGHLETESTSTGQKPSKDSTPRGTTKDNLKRNVSGLKIPQIRYHPEQRRMSPDSGMVSPIGETKPPWTYGKQISRQNSRDSPESPEKLKDTTGMKGKPRSPNNTVDVAQNDPGGQTIPKIRPHPEQICRSNSVEWTESPDNHRLVSSTDEIIARHVKHVQRDHTYGTAGNSAKGETKTVKASVPRNPISKQRSCETPVRTKSVNSFNKTRRTQSQDSLVSRGETTSSRIIPKATGKRRSFGNGKEKNISKKNTTISPGDNRATLAKHQQKGRKDVQAKSKTKSKTKANATSIKGEVVAVNAKWVNNCCKTCFKIVEHKEKLYCKRCKTRASVASELVAQQLVAEVTLKTVAGVKVKKMCHHPELVNFCKDNGTVKSHHRSVELLSAYLKSQRYLEVLLDREGEVCRIIKK